MPPAAAVTATAVAAGCAPVMQQLHNNRSGHQYTDVSRWARAGEAWRPEAGRSGGACMLGDEGSIALMMATHTCGFSGASSLFGPKIDRIGR